MIPADQGWSVPFPSDTGPAVCSLQGDLQVYLLIDTSSQDRALNSPFSVLRFSSVTAYILLGVISVFNPLHSKSQQDRNYASFDFEPPRFVHNNLWNKKMSIGYTSHFRCLGGRYIHLFKRKPSNAVTAKSQHCTETKAWK